MPDESWLKADLIEHALTLGLDVSQSMTKAQLLELIHGAR